MNIEQFFEAEEKNMLRDLSKLMEYQSVTEDRECCMEALKYVLSLAESFGMKTRIGKHGDIGIAEIGEGEKTLGILVHVDVVDKGNETLWKYEPFRLTTDKGMLYGRGIVDDKGPVISNLYAMKYLLDSGIELKKKIMLIIGTSEEMVWTDMEHFKEEFPLPDFGYSPDGNFPIFNQENGYINISLNFQNALPEAIDCLRGGDAENSIPSLSVCKFKDGTETIYEGKAAHSSTPSQGINAIILLCSDLAEKYELPFAGFLKDNFAEGQYESAIPFNRVDGQTSVAGDLTIVPTTLRSESRNVIVNLNVRNSHKVTGISIIEALKNLGIQYGFTVSVTELHNPIFVDEKQSFISRMKDVSRAFGISDDCRHAQGSSYAKCLNDFVSWGPVFEEDPDCAHMENETQSKESYIKSAKLYSAYLKLEGENS